MAGTKKTATNGCVPVSPRLRSTMKGLRHGGADVDAYTIIAVTVLLHGRKNACSYANRAFRATYVGSRCKTETRLVVGPPFAQSSPAMFATEQTLPQLEPQTAI